jgi:KipI family sensor histidine kinase inhibitor
VSPAAPSPSPPAIVPLGEEGWTVVLGDRVDPEVHRRVTQLAARLAAATLPGLVEIVPAYAAVTVFFDAGEAPAEEVREAIARVAAAPAGEAAEPPPSHLVPIPVRYDGPDLSGVAERTGLSPDEVIRRHAAPEYRVYLLGFAPGFAYLGDLDPALVLPRRSSPRTRVPAGSVAIAGAQTAVYPLPTPGGWHLIGSTPLVLFDPSRDPAALLRVGDRVRFVPEP